MEGFDVFLQRVSGIRTVEGRMINYRHCRMASLNKEKKEKL